MQVHKCTSMYALDGCTDSFHIEEEVTDENYRIYNNSKAHLWTTWLACLTSKDKDTSHCLYPEFSLTLKDGEVSFTINFSCSSTISLHTYIPKVPSSNLSLEANATEECMVFFNG